ncbi:MAG: alpha/beta hydrolase fold domain-containing protein [Methyloprofundus sp.]|nr:alpha/beta hydrolase fold domain-containing protein [Methyloprofundus sp.]
MIKTPLSCVEIPAASTPIYSIIWLHGLGADGHDFESIAPELKLQQEQHIHFIFPNAPIQPVTINGGMEMRSWYDILAADLEREVAIDDIYQSAQAVTQLIEQEIEKGIKAENILLAGFSQGGVIALHAGLRFPKKLAGIIALSTYLPTIEQLKSERSINNNNTPIFMAHGSMDPVVMSQAAKKSFTQLKELSYPISWHEYPMQHSVCLEEITDIAAFINPLLN